MLSFLAALLMDMIILVKVVIYVIGCKTNIGCEKTPLV